MATGDVSQSAALSTAMVTALSTAMLTAMATAMVTGSISETLLWRRNLGGQRRVIGIENCRPRLGRRAAVRLNSFTKVIDRV